MTPTCSLAVHQLSATSFSAPNLPFHRTSTLHNTQRTGYTWSGHSATCAWCEVRLFEIRHTRETRSTHACTYVALRWGKISCENHLCSVVPSLSSSIRSFIGLLRTRSLTSRALMPLTGCARKKAMRQVNHVCSTTNTGVPFCITQTGNTSHMGKKCAQNPPLN